MNSLLTFSTTDTPKLEEFLDVLRRSTLGERRPLHDDACMAQMHAATTLWATCRENGRLLGFARSLTDFSYACYLADLAVDQACARQGIGQQLIAATHARLGPHAKIILLSAPKAVDYYPHIGFTQHPSAWTLNVTPSPPA